MLGPPCRWDKEGITCKILMRGVYRRSGLCAQRENWQSVGSEMNQSRALPWRYLRQLQIAPGEELEFAGQPVSGASRAAIGTTHISPQSGE